MATGSALTLIATARQRVLSALDLAKNLEGADFPYNDSLEALRIEIQSLEDCVTQLDDAARSSTSAVIQSTCKAVTSHLWTALPRLGFIIRSTDVRNAFEVYGPLRDICKRLLGPSSSLVLSSEWDYSPYVFTEVPALPGYVLIGLPASESSNPLLLPLAGHELGHPLWQSHPSLRILEQSILASLRDHIINNCWTEFAAFFPSASQDDVRLGIPVAPWKLAYDWTVQRGQEVFCDCLGVRLFGEPYLLAFAYLIAPSPTGMRPRHYPNLRQRAAYLVDIATAYGFNAPTGYADLFHDLLDPSDGSIAFLSRIADETLSKCVPLIVRCADERVRDAGIPDMVSANVERIVPDLCKYIVPARESNSLAEIVAAGWQAHNDPNLWNGHPARKQRTRVLRDLLLKSIEALDIRRIELLQ